MAQAGVDTQTPIPNVTFAQTDYVDLVGFEGRIAVFVESDGEFSASAKRLNRSMKGALARLVESKSFANAKTGEVFSLAWPTGFVAEAIDVVKLPRTSNAQEAVKAGAAIGALRGAKDLLVLADTQKQPASIAMGVCLRDYSFDQHKSPKDGAAADERSGDKKTVIMTSRAEKAADDGATLEAEVAGTFFARDLTNEPANILTTTEFANRLKALEAYGLEVEILEEEQLEALGMRMLLSVGHGSASPSKVAVMKWQGTSPDEAPLALIGKGVVFDTGGISLKPAAGMEEMTMDMGGAAVVAGVMKTLAMRKAEANVVGLVGLVENMPSDRASRPGDIVRSMKGDTVEIINTDAEGRLVLGDVMWYAQDRFEPRGMIDLATLTGAIITGLGHEKAGVFSNSEPLCNRFLKAAQTEGEGAWRMPLDDAYAEALKSRLADVKNVGGRAGGSITAAKFLERFVKDDMPWIHIDIAGVASVTAGTQFAPKGATGWGVRSLNRMIEDLFGS